MIKKSRFVTVYLLFIVVGLYLNLHSDVAVPTNKPFSEFPVSNNGWQMHSQSEFSDNVLNVLRPTDYLSRQYTGPDGKQVSLYIGYHSGGKNSGGIHSPKHCLPGSGWYEASSKRTELEVEGKKIKLVRALYQKGESREMFLYWFQVKDKSLSEEYSLKLSEIMNSLLYRRRDSTFIRISVPFETNEARAVATGEQFIRDFYPVIMGFLPS
jgi:EpsI family protein